MRMQVRNLWRNRLGRKAVSRIALGAILSFATFDPFTAPLAPLAGPRMAVADTGPIFKVVRPPRPGARRRVTIVDPTRAMPPGMEAPARRTARHDWFWQANSPALAAADPARLAALAPSVFERIGAPADRAAAARIAARFGDEIGAAAAAGGISEALLIAVAMVESAGNPNARSPKGAQGLVQLIPATARRFGVADPFDPAANLRGGAVYLDFLLKEFGEDAILALAGYNAGEGAVRRNGGVPPYVETRDYAPKVLSAFAAASQLCRKAPETARDRCELIATD